MRDTCAPVHLPPLSGLPPPSQFNLILFPVIECKQDHCSDCPPLPPSLPGRGAELGRHRRGGTSNNSYGAHEGFFLCGGGVHPGKGDRLSSVQMIDLLQPFCSCTAKLTTQPYVGTSTKCSSHASSPSSPVPGTSSVHPVYCSNATAWMSLS